MSGHFWAWGSFIVGLMCGGYAWAFTARYSSRSLIDKVMRVGFSANVALAVFCNLAYMLWIAGMPLEMGIVKDGRMAEHYWLGPFTLIYAVVMWFTLNKSSKSQRRK